MLHELNLQALARLNLPRDDARLADLGCGTGATARAAVAVHPNLSVDAITIVPSQVMLGREQNSKAVRGEAITMHCEDYISTTLPTGQFDGVCVIESACHAEGPTKSALLREAHRLLKPGGTLVMVDAMLLRELPSNGFLSRFMGSVYRRWCECWAVPEMCRVDLLAHALVAEGFDAPTIEDWSWRITPSVAHVPILASYFAIAEIVKARGSLPKWRWRHIVASLLTPLLGLWRSTVIYAAVTARKPK
jgi:SAM-dependent methyltransferase